MTTTPEMPLSDDDMQTSQEGIADPAGLGKDTDGTDVADADGGDAGDADSSDADDADGADAS